MYICTCIHIHIRVHILNLSYTYTCQNALLNGCACNIHLYIFHVCGCVYVHRLKYTHTHEIAFESVCLQKCVCTYLCMCASVISSDHRASNTCMRIVGVCMYVCMSTRRIGVPAIYVWDDTYVCVYVYKFVGLVCVHYVYAHIPCICVRDWISRIGARAMHVCEYACTCVNASTVIHIYTHTWTYMHICIQVYTYINI